MEKYMTILTRKVRGVLIAVSCLSFITVNPEPNSRNMEYDPKQNLFLMAADKEVKTLEDASNKLWREKQQRLDETGEKAIRDAYNALHTLESSCQFLSP